MKILVSGATGQLAAGLLEASEERDGFEFVLASRGTRRRAAKSRVSRAHPDHQELANSTLDIDVQEPYWGLDDLAVDELSDIDVVLNLAAETNWAASRSRHIAVNTIGADAGLQLSRRIASHHRRRVLYCYASSIHAAGARTGRIPEEAFTADAQRTPYEQSKWLAEEMLLNVPREDDVQVLVVRIGGLVGNSLTGATAKRNSLYMLADRWGEFPLGVLPVARSGRVDMMPRDFIGGMLLELLESVFEHAHQIDTPVHLCAGDTAPTAEALFAVVRSLDVDGLLPDVNPLYVPGSSVLFASRQLERVAKVPASWQNLLIGVRYLSIDRVFDRAKAAALIRRQPDGITAHDLARICFGLDPQRPVETRTESALATFRA